MKNEKAFKLISECLRDYSMPLLVVGPIKVANDEYVTSFSATIPREELIIRNGKRPDWYSKVIDNSLRTANILYITDFDQISIEEQKLFIDMICRNTISGETMPENLEIVISGKNKFPVLPEIMENVQFIEI